MRKLIVGGVMTTVVALLWVASAAAARPRNGQIAIARQVPGGGADIFVANPDATQVKQVPLVYPADDFGVPRWSPDGNQLLISTIDRVDVLGNFLPFRAAKVALSGANFNLLEPPNAGFDMGCPRGLVPGCHAGSLRVRRGAHRVCSASAPPTEAILCD